MTKEDYTVITTDALDMLHDNIEVVCYGNKITDDGYTHFNVLVGEDDDRWDIEKLNELISAYGCEIVGEEIVYKSNVVSQQAVMAVVQAITAIETYLYFVPKLEKKE